MAMKHQDLMANQNHDQGKTISMVKLNFKINLFPNSIFTHKIIPC